MKYEKIYDSGKEVSRDDTRLVDYRPLATGGPLPFMICYSRERHGGAETVHLAQNGVVNPQSDLSRLLDRVPMIEVKGEAVILSSPEMVDFLGTIDGGIQALPPRVRNVVGIALQQQAQQPNQ